MALFENTLKQIKNAAALMNLSNEMVDILSNPQRVIEVNLPIKMDDGSLKVFKGYRVQHNNFRGPYKGGIRYHQQVDLSEVSALSAWMSIKCGVVGIPLGGGKGGVIVNPKELSEGELERLTRAYVRGIAPAIGPKTDVPAPDVNTTPQIMAWIADEYSKYAGHDAKGVVTGKPVEAGGSKGRGTATAQGGVFILEELVKEQGLNPAEMKVIIQGFGNAGATMVQLLTELGFSIVGTSDSRGGIVCNHGIDPATLMNCKVEKKTVTECTVEVSEAKGMDGSTCKRVTNEELLEEDCDILILAALENQVTGENADKIKAKIVLELANGPVNPEADKILAERGVVVVPDILANAGGVTVSYFEMLQNADDKYWEEEEVREKLKTTMTDAWKAVKANAEKHNATYREGAFITAMARIQEKAVEMGVV